MRLREAIDCIHAALIHLHKINVSNYYHPAKYVRRQGVNQVNNYLPSTGGDVTGSSAVNSDDVMSLCNFY